MTTTTTPTSLRHMSWCSENHDNSRPCRTVTEAGAWAVSITGEASCGEPVILVHAPFVYTDDDGHPAGMMTPTEAAEVGRLLAGTAHLARVED